MTSLWVAKKETRLGKAICSIYIIDFMIMCGTPSKPISHKSAGMAG
jgi:hypothetical protein